MEEMEEKSVTFSDIIKVLLGNKWLYLILAGVFFVVSCVGLYIYSSFKKEYISFFNYDVPGFSAILNGNGTTSLHFVDGSSFDSRSLLAKERFAKYIAANEELSGLDAEDLYYDGVVKSFGYTIVYKENAEKMRDDDDAYVVDKAGCKVVMDKSKLSSTQAAALSEEIANEILEISKEKINAMKYNTYLNLYDVATSYADEISYLQSALNDLRSRYESLISSYGDIVIPAGQYGGTTNNYYLESQKISDVLHTLNLSFVNYDFASYFNEIELNGYIDAASLDYINELKTEISDINRKIAVDISVRNDLIAQRDALVTSTASITLESFEISAYNNRIIELTQKIADEQESIAIKKITLDKLDLNSLTTEEQVEYNTNISAFEDKLAEIRSKLEFSVNQYTALNKQLSIDNMYVYFENSKIVEQQGGLGIAIILCIAVAVAIFLPMFVNIAIWMFRIADGKKLLGSNKEIVAK